METYYKINEIAKLFNIPVSTLHYWESIGLFTVKRNKENEYREYTHSDILNIWEIVLYRELNIPVAQIAKLIGQDVTTIGQMYEENEKRIEQEIQKLLEQKARIGEQQQMIRIVERLEDRILEESCPNFSCCKIDNFQIDSIKESLEHPYDCVVYSKNPLEKTLTRGIIMNQIESEKILWEKSQSRKQYLEFLLEVSLDDLESTNMSHVYAYASKNGLCTGELIARYLLVATKEGKRFEYYQAWLEVR